MAQADEAARGLDVSVPNAARMYDYFLGGKDNFEADRVTADRILALVPQLRQSVVENRRFIGRVVRFLAAEAGIDQFLDIGAGLPTRDPVHQVAQKINPRARVVYADYDPVVVTHGSALLAVPDRSVMVRADLRRPGELLAHPGVRGFLDLGRPVAVMLIAIMHFVPDSDDPRAPRRSRPGRRVRTAPHDCQQPGRRHATPVHVCRRRGWRGNTRRMAIPGLALRGAPTRRAGPACQSLP